MTTYSATELLVVLTARTLRDGDRVFAGVGIPLLAALLAKQLDAPSLQVIVEGGVVDPEVMPGRLPISTNEMRIGRRATMLLGITDTFLLAQRGFLNRGIIGAAQVDAFGNVNTSVIGPAERPVVRLPGTGGANDIASLCGDVTIVTTHEPRRFVERLDFLTSPGWLTGGDSRDRSGLPMGGVSRVITDLGMITFPGPVRRPHLSAVHRGVTPAEVQAATAFEFVVSADLIRSDSPSPRELKVLRALIGEAN